MGESLGLSFIVRNAADAPVPNHHCTISIYEWRDNVSYPLEYFRLRDYCLEGFSITGETVSASEDLPPECFFTTLPNGEFYFIHRITGDGGYHTAPDTGAYIGGYGSYKIEAHCGTTGNLSYSDNFTVIPQGEPTWMMDWFRFPVNYPVHTAVIIGILVVVAIFIFILREWWNS